MKVPPRPEPLRREQGERRQRADQKTMRPDIDTSLTLWTLLVMSFVFSTRTMALPVNFSEKR